MADENHVYPIIWQDDHVLLVDQQRLPKEYALIEIRRCEDMGEALQRGLIPEDGAVEIAAAYGLCLAAKKIQADDRREFLKGLEQKAQALRASLPGHVQMRQTLDKLLHCLQKHKGAPPELEQELVQMSQRLHLEALQVCYRIGDHSFLVLPPEPEKLSILTYGSAGALATAGYGTAMALIRRARRENRLNKVLVAETRPNFQGAHLTAWECLKEDIPITILADNTAAIALQKGLVDGIVVGAEQVAANGDVANLAGTYNLALVAQAHRIPFWVATTVSRINYAAQAGDDLVLPPDQPDNLYQIGDSIIYPSGAEVYAPTWDITPAHLITNIITEQGVVIPTNLSEFQPVTA